MNDDDESFSGMVALASISAERIHSGETVFWGGVQIKLNSNFCALKSIVNTPSLITAMPIIKGM
ncbi:hypothetical protein [Paracoccus yeei]|uniref:hypothetical protein n=1 Tax=Paracoccus yeei TaxID=147645 RepID=UPI0012FD10B9|nr:hypothetical protein [Paracoccus yeei]